MKNSISLLLFIALVVHCSAQQPLDTPPPGPLIQQRAPEFSTWTITHPSGPSQGGGQAAPKGDVIKVVKTKDIAVQQSTNAKGETWLCYYKAGRTALVYPDGKNAIILEGSLGGAEAFYQSDFSTTDFPKFSWVSKSSFAGVEKIQGRTFLIFHGRFDEEKGEVAAISTLPTEKGEKVEFDGNSDASVTAYVDVETRLPAFWKRGANTLIFTFGPPPQAILVMPETVANLFKMKEVSAQSMVRKFSPSR